MAISRREAAAGLIAAAAVGLSPQLVRARQIPDAQIRETPDEPHTEIDTTGDPFVEMVAPVSINGQGPFPFLIDTGANISCVSHKLAEQLALKPGPPARVHSVVGVRMRPCVVIDHLQVGARNRRAVRAPALPIRGRAVGGVLGIDWLKGQRLVLGIKDRKLEITNSRNDTPRPNSVLVPARQRWGQLTIVDADVSGRPIQALIDSGSQLALCNKALRDMVGRMDRDQAPGVNTQVVRMETIMGESFEGELIYLPFMRLGGLHLGNVPVVCADAHVFDIWGVQKKPAVVLGMDLLSEFRSVALDFGRATVRFDL